MRPSSALRGGVVVGVHVGAVAVARAGRIEGDESAQLGTVLRAAAGLGAVVHLDRRGRVRLWLAALLRVGVVSVVGACVACEVLPRDRASVEFGATVGAVAGVLTAAALYWLRHL